MIGKGVVIIVASWRQIMMAKYPGICVMSADMKVCTTLSVVAAVVDALVGLLVSVEFEAMEGAVQSLATNPYVQHGYRFCQGNCSTVPRPLNEFTSVDSKKCKFCCERKRKARHRASKH